MDENETPEDELDMWVEDADPIDTAFTHGERKLAEAFIALQHQQVVFGYWQTRKLVKEIGEKKGAEDGS